MKSIRDGGRKPPIPDELSKKYRGMNEGELMQELFSQAAQARRDGSLSAEQLDAFFEFVSPQLDASSRNRLKELIRQIKGGA